MKYASEDLKNEHEGILFGLEVLQEMVRRLNEQQLDDAGDLKEMVNFFKLFADKCHHGKEENLFFPSLEKAGVKNQGGPIGQMLIEHAEGRQYIARMAEALAGDFQAAGFAAAAAGYIQLLRAHIEKENNVLFQMGDRLLKADEQVRLLEAFEEHEELVMGAGTHQLLHGMLERFEQKYLA